MRIAIVGSGAREHAEARALLRDPRVTDGVLGPGNTGMIALEEMTGISDEIIIDPKASSKNPQSYLEMEWRYHADLWIVSQDDALALGTADLLRANGKKVFGPNADGAQIEADKNWSRKFMIEYGIAVPEFQEFKKKDGSSKKYAMSLLDKFETVFFKANGLDAGKGVIPANNEKEVEAAFDIMQEKGVASELFLVEEGMVGEEFSMYALFDGDSYVIFNSAQDNKREYNGDFGRNTGGMGVISPAMVTEGLEDLVKKQIFDKVLKGFKDKGIDYRGIIYLGGMKLKDRSVKVVEFNARWGDPEVQTILPGLKTSYLNLVEATVEGDLKNIQVEQDDLTRVCLVGASPGYPGSSTVKGKKINIEWNRIPENVEMYSAGMVYENGIFRANGGRLFSLVGAADNVFNAHRDTLRAMSAIDIEGIVPNYRTDIGSRDIMRYFDGK